MKNKRELIEELQKVIKENKDSVPFKREVLKEYSKKGINSRIVTNIFEDLIEIEELTDIELIALTKGCYSSTGLEILNIEEYFSSMKLLEYDIFIEKQESILNTLEFENCIKINAKEYLAVKNLKDLSLYRKSRLIAYNKSLQRKPKIITLPNGVQVVKKSVNLEAIKTLKARFKNKDLKTTAISLCILRIENKKPLYNFTEYEGHNNIGTLSLKPIFDIKSDNYAPLIIPDGYHRYSSACDSYDECKKNDIDLEGSLGVFIYFMTVEEVKQYITDVFQRSDTDEEWIQTLNQTDANRTAKELIDKITILNNGKEVAPTYSDMKTLNFMTCNQIIVEGIERTTLSTGDELEVAEGTDKMADIINMLIERMTKINRTGNIKETILLSPNIFVGYIILADRLRQDSQYKQKIVKIADILTDLNTQEELRKLNLNHKYCNYKNISDYFINILEVIDNEGI